MSCESYSLEQRHGNYIVVYILETEESGGTQISTRSEVVRHLFNDPLFITNIVKIDVPEDWIKKYKNLSKEDAEELYRYRWCLNDARQRSSQAYVIVIKDTSTSNVDSRTIAEIVSATRKLNNWHLCYLCKWMDRCDLYTDKVPITGKATVIAKTYSPYGCQALFFSPYGRDIILEGEKMKNGEYINYNQSLSNTLNRCIEKKYIDATCIVPNLISYDLSCGVYNELTECRNPNNNGTNNGSGSSVFFGSGFAWLCLLLIILAIALLIWFVCAAQTKSADPCIEEC